MDPFYTGQPRFQTPFLLLWRHYTSSKYPLKFHQNEHWMTCHPPWLTQPTPSFFTILFMAWTCWTHALHSWVTWLLFQDGENRHKFQPNFEAHQPAIPLSTFQGMGSFVTQTTQMPHTKFTLHQP